MFRLLDSVRALLISAAAANAVAAQQPVFHYPVPPPSAVRVTRDVRFARVDTFDLAMDVYRPARGASSAPALILFGAHWPPEAPRRKSDPWIRSWARIAAAEGIVAIIPDLRGEPGTATSTTPLRLQADDFERLVAFVRAHAAEYGIDPNRLVLHAASGSVDAALPKVEDSRQSAIAAAVVAYGAANLTTFRQDVPLLWIRAGLDSPGMNARIDRLVALALAQNAPVTVLNLHAGHHGFELADEGAATRDAIDRTIAFVKEATTPAYRAAMRAGRLDALAAAQVRAGNHSDAAQTFAELLKQRPSDAEVRVAYGEALLESGDRSAACRELTRWPDRQRPYSAMVSGARACVLAGSVDTAMAWLRGMPRDWLRFAEPSLRSDSALAPLRQRAGFDSLFTRADSVSSR